MAITHHRSKRKRTGGRYIASLKKKLRHLGSLPTLTSIGARKFRQERTMGGGSKKALRTIDTANVYDPATKKYLKLKIESVIDNKANVNYIRRNILTQGAIIKTEKGEARITSRPGQTTTVNAVLLKK
ncbi:MAG TPA: 30S ribosomal protein S8e [Candidatus Nanoarchaeia archaeon]|nr:30S ribosomal protein S8e [Candidatus Nanoarchaeia archaeon]